MAFTSFVHFLLSNLLLLCLIQAKGRSDSACPNSFSCFNLTDLSFPFSLSTQPDCGIMSMSACDTRPYPRIQLLPGGDLFYAKAIPDNFTLWLVDPKLQTTLRQHNCQAFNKSISLPDSLSISFKIMSWNLHDFFKCNSSTRNVTGYRVYNGCKGFQIFRINLCSLMESFSSTGTVCFIVGLMILLFYLREKIFCCKWESNAEDHKNIKAFLKDYGSYAPKRYSYSQVKRITSCFRNKLGQGGYGYVYKGFLLNGSHVAVKVLNKLQGSGEEFINEVASISRTSHVNIVSLVGFCFEGHRRALIYEFMPNGSLEKFIYEERSNGIRQLSWPVLFKIALGIARGLEYLHRGCNTRILHFDIKPHNILLDEDFCPKISDFGLAKLCMKKESIVSMLGARGTIGYIAPEIVLRNLGGVSHKSDVYSYGMMVLEMVGGRKNVDAEVDRTSEIYFPHWLYR